MINDKFQISADSCNAIDSTASDHPSQYSEQNQNIKKQHCVNEHANSSSKIWKPARYCSFE